MATLGEEEGSTMAETTTLRGAADGAGTKLRAPAARRGTALLAVLLCAAAATVAQARVTHGARDEGGLPAAAGCGFEHGPALI